MKLIHIVDLDTWEDWGVYIITSDKFDDELYEVDIFPDIEDEWTKLNQEYEGRKDEYVWIHLTCGICGGGNDNLNNFTKVNTS